MGEKVRMIGRVRTIVKTPDGELRYSAEEHNDAADLVKNVLANAICVGTLNACSDFLTAGVASGSAWNNKDGIFIHSSDATNSNGTVLAGGITASTNTNVLNVTASNSLFNTGTMSLFVLGTNFSTAAGAGGAYFSHTPGTFAYSSGDTITVNWTVSVT